MVTNSLSERLGAGPGRCKVCWIIGDPFITSSTMVKMVVRTVALSSICSALLVCIVYTLKRTTVLFPCQQLAQSVLDCLLILNSLSLLSRLGEPGMGVTGILGNDVAGTLNCVAPLPTNCATSC